jgi:hypothetical protein
MQAGQSYSYLIGKNTKVSVTYSLQARIKARILMLGEPTSAIKTSWLTTSFFALSDFPAP